MYPACSHTPDSKPVLAASPVPHMAGERCMRKRKPFWHPVLGKLRKIHTKWALAHSVGNESRTWPKAECLCCRASGAQAACVQLNLRSTIPLQAGLALAPLSQLQCSWWPLQTPRVSGPAAVSCPGAIPSLLVEDKHSWARFSHTVSAATRQSGHYKTLTTPVTNVSIEYSSYLLFTIF